MLDNDGFRFDKATQVTVDALADYSETVRNCARKLGKQNFFMPGGRSQCLCRKYGPR